MFQTPSRPPSGILRQLLARLQPAASAPAAASLAFMMLAPAAAMAQAAARAETTLPTVTIEDTADPMQVNNGYRATETQLDLVQRMGEQNDAQTAAGPVESRITPRVQ